jgi:arylsulfatase A-like enzyme
LVSTKAISPNIVIIAADDMGYADLGVYGSEISTPELDNLAADGMLFTNFHTLPDSSPGRAVLLTGVDNHRNGLGTTEPHLRNEPNHQNPDGSGKDGYEAYLNENVVTIASLLYDSGYHTYIAGKWHLGDEERFRPWERGFEHSLVMLEGGGDHYTKTQALGSPLNYL